MQKKTMRKKIKRKKESETRRGKEGDKEKKRNISNEQINGSTYKYITHVDTHDI